MLKKVLALGLTLMLVGGAVAQQTSNNELHGIKGKKGAKTITFAASDIQYWVGTGSNSAIVIIGWDDNATPTALAWGVHWNGSTTATGLLDSIVAHDSRFSYSISGSMMNSMAYNDGTLNLQPNPDDIGWWCYYLNGDWGPYAWPNCPVANNDVIEASESCSWSLTTAIAATDPNGSSDDTPEDASFDASDILYWVGEGSNEVVMAVNWADTALAWGYRFNGESVSVATMMDDIAAADFRFSYSTNGGFISDINFICGNDTLGVTAGNYWWSLLNHVAGMGMSDMLHDGDFYKWGDLSVAVVTDSTWVADWSYWDYTNVWPYAIHPVSVPSTTPEVGPFCGAAGTEGSSAISYNDPRIKAWATGCTIVRGSQNLSDPDATTVTFGTENEAIGAASASTTDVVSLGDGGSATLTFAHPIKNGDGFDFAVFENSFNDGFLELAFVEVSSDGINFVRFPATSLTQTDVQIGGNGPVDPTFINNLAGKYRVGYGTPFDLEELRDSTNVDINNITHIRVVDVVGSIDPQYGTYDAFGHIINDPFPTISHSAGFDLDGIGVLNQATTGIDDREAAQFRAYPNPAVDNINVVYNGAADAAVVKFYDMTGREIISSVIANGSTIQIATSHLPNGIYMLRVNEEVEKIVVRH